MALLVTLTPNVSSWSLGDPAITVSMSGGDTNLGNQFLWESNSGTFANRFNASTTFTPNNATEVVEIVARRVFHNNFGGGANFTAFGDYGVSKTSGAASAWDSYIFLLNAGVNVGYSVEAEAVETNTEKAVGFLSNSSYRDPTVTNANPDNTFILSWHFLANGTAIPRRYGVAVGSAIPYKNGDNFRIIIEGYKVSYLKNGLVAATTMRVPTNSLFATMSFKTMGASLNAFTYQTIEDNQGTKTINVLGVLPINPNYSYELTNDNYSHISVAEDGTEYHRKRGNSKKGFSLQFNQRTFEEYSLLYNFWGEHDRTKEFVYRDLPTNTSYVVRFESGLQTTVEGPCVITAQASIKEL